MNLVHHVLDIEAPQEMVFASITTADGLSSWWTELMTGESFSAIGAEAQTEERD